MKLRWIALVIAAVLVPVLGAGALLHGFSYAASFEIRHGEGLEARDHNAIKHAYAAAELYSWLRLVAGPDCAASAVIALGEGNEALERYVKRMTDWSPETYKDLRNNLTGIAAAEWLHGEAGFAWPWTRLSLIGRLARTGTLVLDYEDKRVPPLPHKMDTGIAVEKMRGDEAGLRAALAAEIAAQGAALRKDIGLD